MDYPTQLQQIGLSIITEFTRAKDFHDLQCNTCKHIWSATPISKLQGFKKHKQSGCPVCNKNRKALSVSEKINDMKQIIKDKGYTILEEFTGSNARDVTTYTKIRREVCGHEWDAILHQIAYANVQCKICNNEIKRSKIQQYNEKRHKQFLLTADDWGVYKSDVRSLTEQNYNKHIDKINPKNLTRGLAGTDGAYQLDHIISVRWCFDYGIPSEVCADHTNLQMLPWVDNIKKNFRFTLDYIPETFRPYIRDDFNATSCLFTIMDMLRDNGIEFESNPSILSPYRVDIFIKSKNIALRVYDTCINTEQHIPSKNIMVSLFKASQVKNIKLLQIFTDELMLKPELTINKIKYLCGISTKQEKIFARHCTIQPINGSIKNTFLDMFHIQGHDKSQINIGAYHPNDPKRLIAVMTFARPRVIMGSVDKKDGSWELSRFATDNSTMIVGIASKLLSYFVKTEHPSMVYSYADVRWSVGNVYHQLGFTLNKHNNANYYYVVKGKRMHRWGFRKDAIRYKYPDIYDATKTEYAMMLEVGIDRIWDAGTMLFIKTF